MCAHVEVKELYGIVSLILEFQGLNLGQQACTGSAFTQGVIALTLKISKIINKNLKRRSIKLGMAAHAYNLSTQEPRDEDSKFKANLGYIIGPCLKKKLECKMMTQFFK